MLYVLFHRYCKFTLFTIIPLLKDWKNVYHIEDNIDDDFNVWEDLTYEDIDFDNL